MTTRTINEGNIQIIMKPVHTFRLPISLHPIVWRIVHENNTSYFIHTKNIECSECRECSECDESVNDCIYLSDKMGEYYLCKKCCSHIWNYFQDTIF